MVSPKHDFAQSIKSSPAGRFSEIEAEFRSLVIARICLTFGIVVLGALIARFLIAPMGTVFTLMQSFFALALITVSVLIRRGLKTANGTLIAVLSLCAIGVNAGLSFGGIKAPACIVFIVIPAIGWFGMGKIGGRIALAVMSVGLFLVLGAERAGWITQVPLVEKYAEVKTLMYFVSALGIYGLSAAFEHSRRESAEQILILSQKMMQSAKLASLGEMAGGVAHEINNPLAIISGKAMNLAMRSAKGTLQPEVLNSELERIQVTSERIANIVKGLLAFSREAENAPLSDVSIKTVIDGALNLCAEKIRNRGIELRTEAIAEADIRCQSAQISHVLVSLLNNAIDAVEALPVKWIAISATLDFEKVRIHVTDSGDGIEDAVVEKMMQPFFTTKDVGKGIGLGLSTAYGFAKEHGGDLYYDRSSRNTCFTLELPRAGA